MKEATFNKTGSRQVINSGWKEFDKQTNLISTGNVYANTQVSSYIRPWKDAECNGVTFPKGHLMKYDLKPFEKFGIPRIIDDIIRNEKRDRSVILYMFFTADKQGAVMPFAWVLTTHTHEYITDALIVGYGKKFAKRFDALKECKKYITK